MTELPIFIDGTKPVLQRDPGGPITVYRPELTPQEREEVNEYMLSRITGSRFKHRG